MRVGIYVRNLAPDAGGGFTLEDDVSRALIAARDSTRHEIVLLGLGLEPPEGPLRDAYISVGRGRLLATARKGIGRTARAIRGAGSVDGHFWFERELDRHRIDLVWCVGPGSPTRTRPYVTTIWDLQHRRQPVFPEVAAGDEWARREAFFQVEIGRAALVVVGTEAGRLEVEHFYGVLRERIRVIRLPTPSYALAAASKQSDITQPADYVLYPAQFWPHKDHMTVLRALAKLRSDRGLARRAVFVGSDKGNRAYLRRQVSELGLDDQVEFLGFVPRQQLIDLYRRAIALTFVSRFGPDNLPPLEAFALGCPVIASRVPGAEEQLGDAALLVTPGSADEVADAIWRLHSEPDTRSFLIDAGHRQARAFTAADYAAQVITYIEELAPTIASFR